MARLRAAAPSSLRCSARGARAATRTATPVADARASAPPTRLFPRVRASRRRPARPRRGRGGGGGGGGGRRRHAEEPARARDPAGRQTVRAGRLAGGGARFRPIREATLAVGAAATWCDEHAALQSAQGTSLTKAKACAGFSVELGADGAADPQTKERPVRR